MGATVKRSAAVSERTSSDLQGCSPIGAQSGSDGATVACCVRNDCGCGRGRYEPLPGRYRYRLLLKAPKDVHVQPVLRRWLRQVRTGGGVRIQIDVDPYSFM